MAIQFYTAYFHAHLKWIAFHRGISFLYYIFHKIFVYSNVKYGNIFLIFAFPPYTLICFCFILNFLEWRNKRQNSLNSLKVKSNKKNGYKADIFKNNPRAFAFVSIEFTNKIGLTILPYILLGTCLVVFNA